MRCDAIRSSRIERRSIVVRPRRTARDGCVCIYAHTYVPRRRRRVASSRVVVVVVARGNDHDGVPGRVYPGVHTHMHTPSVRRSAGYV